MSQNFRLSFDKSLENTTNKPVLPALSGQQNEFYEQEGLGRNICFVKEDGSRIFLSYGHLINCEYSPDDNIIRLEFTTHSITLKGACLEHLFYSMMQQIIRQIVCVDSRYDILKDPQSWIVNEIAITAKEN